MNRALKKALGIGLVSLPFLGLFIYIVVKGNIMLAVGVFGAMILIVGLVFAGVYLILSNS